MIESHPMLRRLSQTSHGNPVGPALSKTCSLGQATKGRKTDEAKARGFSIRARVRNQCAPALEAEYMTATDSLPAGSWTVLRWGAVHI
jgi:hypothetical protein